MWHISLYIIIIKGIDILSEMLNVSNNEIRAIDMFMLVMAVISLVLVVVNAIKWFIERNKSA